MNATGLNISPQTGGLDKSDISQIIEFAEADGAGLGEAEYADNTITVMGRKTYASEECNLMELYCSHLRQLIIARSRQKGKTSCRT